jgi:hypothetical protein
MCPFWTTKTIIMHIPYSSMEEYYIFLAKFLIMTHLLPIIYVVGLMMHQDYFDFYIEQRTGKPPVDHEERLSTYYELREQFPVMNDWQKELEMDEKERIFLKEKMEELLNKIQILISEYWSLFLARFREILNEFQK